MRLVCDLFGIPACFLPSEARQGHLTSRRLWPQVRGMEEESSDGRNLTTFNRHTPYFWWPQTHTPFLFGNRPSRICLSVGDRGPTSYYRCPEVAKQCFSSSIGSYHVDVWPGLGWLKTPDWNFGKSAGTTAGCHGDGCNDAQSPSVERAAPMAMGWPGRSCHVTLIDRLPLPRLSFSGTSSAAFLGILWATQYVATEFFLCIN